MSEKIIISLASIEKRSNCLRQVVRSLINQCDKMNVYLNDYKKIPDFLNNKKINVITRGDIGDIGKFYNIENENGIYLTVDDDIIYPSDYVYRMVEFLKSHKNKIAAGVHGCILNLNSMNNYYKDRNLTHYRHPLEKERVVHIIGTGTLAFHTSEIKIRLSDFEKKNMADVWFAILAHKQHIPMILITRSKMWLQDIPEATQMESIYSTSKGKNHGSFQTNIIKQFKGW
jgi:hypothetical protein